MNVLAMEEILDTAGFNLVEAVYEYVDLMRERVELNPNIYENWCIDDYVRLFFRQNTP